MRVTMYKAADGSMFEDKKACAEHDARLRLVPKLKEFVNGTSDDEYNRDEYGNLVLYPDDISLFIARHADELRDILNGVISKRQIVRKPKTASA